MMELLLENVRNTLSGILANIVREVSKVSVHNYAKIAVIIVSSVLLGRLHCFIAFSPAELH